MPAANVRATGIGSPELTRMRSPRDSTPAHSNTVRNVSRAIAPNRAGQMFFSGRLGCGGASIRFLSSTGFGFPLPLPGFGAFTPV